jgi:hypothetical protein
MANVAQQHMLTTLDNPFDPFTRFTEWYNWDESAGYHTSAYLARVDRNSDGLSETDQELAHEQAIDEIVRENVTGNYRKVSRPYVD